ncbi:hypothetical protein LCGC14_1352840, partial [marine sediment metagenome]
YLIGSIVSNGLQGVFVEKPSDNYTVTFIRQNSNLSWAVISTQNLVLTEGTWDVYYPVLGDITTVKIRLL